MVNDWKGGQNGQGMEGQVLQDFLCHSKDSSFYLSETGGTGTLKQRKANVIWLISRKFSLVAKLRLDGEE